MSIARTRVRKRGTRPPKVSLRPLRDARQGARTLPSANVDPSTKHPLDDVTVLASVVRTLVLRGRLEEAERAGAILRSLPGVNPQEWVAQAIALSHLGDDDGVCEVYERARTTIAGLHSKASAMIHHLAGVAACRRGQDLFGFTRLRWAQRLAPELDLAADVLLDRDRPVEKRNGPWAFPLEEWMSPAAHSDLVRACRKAVEPDADDTMLRRLPTRYPELWAVLPCLLDRGDPSGVKLALALASQDDRRRLDDALLRFAQGRHGSDADRAFAVQILASWNRLPNEPLQVWMRGRRATVRTAWPALEADAPPHGPEATCLLEEATDHLHANRTSEMERCLREALVLEPHAADLRMLLGTCQYMQGHRSAAESVMRSLLDECPLLVFPRCVLAIHLLGEKKTTEARAILKPLLERQSVPMEEHGALCSVLVQTSLAEHRIEEAREWYNTLKFAVPDDPSIPGLWWQIARQRLMSWLWRLVPFKSRA